MNFGNGWLRQVPLRGSFLGAPAPKPRKKLGQLSCCNGPDGKGYCFDTGSGECVMTWVSSATSAPGTPACVRDSRGQWVLPSCVGQEGVASGGRPPLPPGCEYVGAESNSIQEVICETYNCTTRESGGWRGLLSDFIAMGSQNPGLKSPEWFPKPAQCPNGPGGGGTYVPPGAAPAPTPTLPTTPIPTAAPGGLSPTAPAMAPPAPAATPTAAPAPSAQPTPAQAAQAAAAAATAAAQAQAPATMPTVPLNDQQPYIGPLPTQRTTYPAIPNGQSSGSPYPPPPAARSYAPPPPAAPATLPTQPMSCPIGPIKVADWTKGCVSNAMQRLR